MLLYSSSVVILSVGFYGCIMTRLEQNIIWIMGLSGKKKICAYILWVFSISERLLTKFVQILFKVWSQTWLSFSLLHCLCLLSNKTIYYLVEYKIQELNLPELYNLWKMYNAPCRNKCVNHVVKLRSIHHLHYWKHQLALNVLILGILVILDWNACLIQKHSKQINFTKAELKKVLDIISFPYCLYCLWNKISKNFPCITFLF